ncbi:MAG: hypothetical protein ACP5HQ_03300 [Thermoprotei archaeon]
MKITANISEPVELKATLEANRITLIVGPNVAGKSVLLRCIFHSITGNKYDLSVETEPIKECSVNENFDDAVYLDPYAITYYIYDKYKDYFREAEEVGEKNLELTRLSKIGKDVSGILRLFYVRSRSRDEDLYEAMRLVEGEVAEVSKEAKEAGHEEEVKYLMPLRISVTPEGIEWRDVFGNEGRSVTKLPPSFYSALALTAMIYSYALSKKEKVLLLLDEPEAFAYPSFAYTLGRVAQRLASSSENLYIIATTHSWDFYKGVMRSSNLVTAYVMTRERNKVTLSTLKEGWYIPGFSLSGVLL